MQPLPCYVVTLPRPLSVLLVDRRVVLLTFRFLPHLLSFYAAPAPASP